MKNLNLVFVALGLSLLAGCAGVGLPDGGGKEASNKNFYQHWVHSYEEQGGKKTPNIFRPKGSKEFPVSRFRMEFGFDTSGQCNYKFLSPNDAHEMRNCVFTKIGNKVYIYDDQGKLLKHLSFTLVKPSSKDEMQLSYGVQAPISKETKKEAKKKQ